HQDKFGDIWIGAFQSGLSRWNAKTKKFIQYHHSATDTRSLSSDIIIPICEDRSGTLWIGTFDGLNRYDRAANAFTRFAYDPQNQFSLSSNVIYSMYTDTFGTLWIGTDHGLNAVDPRTVSDQKHTQFVKV